MSMATLVDPETTRRNVISNLNGKIYKLVMSDEFTTDNRKFGVGDDPVFEALQRPDNSNQALQFYNSSSDYVTTRNGSLIITTKAVKTSWEEVDGSGVLVRHTKNYTSGNWTIFCRK